MKKAIIIAYSLCVLAILAPQMAAAQFSNIVVFGDSLSDTGNVFTASGGTFPPSPLYVEGRFTGGTSGDPAFDQNWIDRLAGTFSIAGGVTPSSLGGTNFAFGGAASGPGVSSVGVPNIGTQVDQYRFLTPFPSTLPLDTTLFVVWGGFNDFLVEPGKPNAKQTADNIVQAVSTLAQSGAEHILVANMGDLGSIPAAGSTPQGSIPSIFDQTNLGAKKLSKLSKNFNNRLHAKLNELEDLVLTPDTTLYRLDVDALLDAVLANPAAFGVSNTDTAVFNEHYLTLAPGDTLPFGPFNPVDPATSLFWDNVHLSTLGHGILAQAALAELGFGFGASQSASLPIAEEPNTPEPTTLAILAVGTVLLTRRRVQMV